MAKSKIIKFFWIAQLTLLSCLSVSCYRIVDRVNAPDCCPYRFSVNDKGKLITDLQWRHYERAKRYESIDPKKYNYKPPLVMAIYRSLQNNLEQDFSADPILAEHIKNGHADIASIDVDFGYQYVELRRVSVGPVLNYIEPSAHFNIRAGRSGFKPPPLGPLLGQYASTRILMKLNVRPSDCDFSIPLKVDTGSQFYPESRVESLSDEENLDQYILKFNQTLANSLAVLRRKSERMLAHVMRYGTCSG